MLNGVHPNQLRDGTQQLPTMLHGIHPNELGDRLTMLNAMMPRIAGDVDSVLHVPLEIEENILPDVNNQKNNTAYLKVFQREISALKVKRIGLM